MFDAADRAEALVAASRRIAASRHDAEIIELATGALLELTGADHVVYRPVVGGTATERDPRLGPGEPLGSTVLEKPVTGGGRAMGTFELRFDHAEHGRSTEITGVIDLIGVVTGSALTMARAAAGDHGAGPADDATHDAADDAADDGGSHRTSGLPDRRRMDRDFIDHSRAGQVGFVIFRIDGDDLTSATHRPGVDRPADRDEVLTVTAQAIRQSIREGDVAYLSGEHEIAVLLPGATKAESAMVAERIRGRVRDRWVEAGWRSECGEPGTVRLTLSGGVTAGRYEDPQRLAERAMSALEDATEESGDVVITDLGA